MLEWDGDAPALLHSIEFALDREIKGDWSFFKHGYQSWTATRSYRPGEVPLALKRPWYQLTRIFRRNRLKVPARFTDEKGRRITLDGLAAGIPLDGRSSILLSFREPVKGKGSVWFIPAQRLLQAITGHPFIRAKSSRGLRYLPYATEA